MNVRITIKGFILNKLYRPLQKACFVLPNLLCAILPMKKMIVLESNPDFADNTFAIYSYILNNNVFPDYEFVWLVSKPLNDIILPEKVSLYPMHPAKLLDRIKKYIMCNRAKIIIDCNRHYPKYKTSHKQLNIYLDHGMPLKNITKYGYPNKLSCQYLICQSPFFVPYLIKQYGLKESQIVVAGVPRDDQLFTKSDSISRLFPESSMLKRIIIWVPTFRRMSSGGRIDCTAEQPFGMPILQSNQDILDINTKLVEAETLLIIKPHPAQDLSFIGNISGSNIRVLYNDKMLEYGIQINELLSQSDAMITDYSGIYYDYLLLDKPVGITLDDFDEYRTQKGFVFDDPLEILKGRAILSVNDFIQFIDEVTKGIDNNRKEREDINKRVNEGMNASSSKRTIDFILSVLK